jgi:hypothetical protein
MAGTVDFFISYTPPTPGQALAGQYFADAGEITLGDQDRVHPTQPARPTLGVGLPSAHASTPTTGVCLSL